MLFNSRLYCKVLFITTLLFVFSNATQHVFLLHGLGRTRFSMHSMGSFLNKNGYNVVNFGYPSTRKTIPNIIKLLKNRLKYIPQKDTVNFVTHSMGGIVVRAFLNTYVKEKVMPYFYRVVMLAPPNTGATQANYFSSFKLVNFIMGPSLKMLKTGSISFVNSLPPPFCEFGIIAGGKKNNEGYSSRIKGDDDGLVGVTETKLKGMKDFLLVKSMHTFIMEKIVVKKAVLNFLKNGFFKKNIN